jgi:hypothetical protein
MRISAYGFSIAIGIAIEIGIEAFGQSVRADSISIPIWISTPSGFLEFSEQNAKCGINNETSQQKRGLAQAERSADVPVPAFAR